MPAARKSVRPRAAIYARCSTSQQDTGMQLDGCRALADQRGWDVVSVHQDTISGVTTSRDGLEALLDDVCTRRVEVVLVWKLDRLGRSLSHVIGLLDDFAKNEVGFTSVNDPGIDTTTATGRLLAQVLACFASYERDLIRMRVQAGLDRARAAGKHCGRPRVDLDLRPAVAMLNAGYGLKAISSSLSIARTTLRRRLRDAGHLAGEEGGHKPSPVDEE